MLNLALLAAAAASTASSPTLVSNAPWWEKVTVTIAGDGKPQSCQYSASHGGGSASQCDVAGAAPVAAKTPAGTPDQFTKITFERRFNPGDTRPDSTKLHAGDTLLGGQVMALAIDEAGSVKGCKVIAKAGDVTPDYGCDEATAEKFQASAKVRSAATDGIGFMTVLVYGHEENMA